MTRVKICGLKTEEEVRAALQAGADMVGFVFYRPVRRYIRPEEVAAIVASCRRDAVLRGRPWQAVGVFVDEPVESVNAIGRLCQLDLVQLCGEEDPAYCAQLERPAIKVVRAGAGAWTAQRLAEAQRGFAVERIMVDSHLDGYYGGTGVPVDWASLAGVMDDKMLAGGLRPENVALALATTRPWGVDVSSGVERDGGKDPELIQAFIREVRAFDNQN